jgi:hypothetical protein
MAKRLPLNLQRIVKETVNVQEQRDCDDISSEGETNKAGFHSCCTVHLDTVTAVPCILILSQLYRAAS